MCTMLMNISEPVRGDLLPGLSAHLDVPLPHPGDPVQALQGLQHGAREGPAHAEAGRKRL